MIENLVTHDNREVILIGTAHVSKESTELVEKIIEKEKPDTVCIELCKSRYQTIKNKAHWQDTDIIKVIKEKKAFLLLSNLLMASFQKKVADKFDITPGAEIIKGIETGESIAADIELVDRDIRVTFSRIWRAMGAWNKMKLLFQLLLSFGEIGDIDEEDIEKMKQKDMLQSLLTEFGESLPVLKKVLVDERDIYLSHKIKHAKGKKIVAVVGAGHVPGIKEYWDIDTSIEDLEVIPPPSIFSNILKWLIPVAILLLFVAGFFYGGQNVGTGMIKWWFLANGVLSGLGAMAALGHPITILSAILAAPLTSLNPMIAAGWVSGLIEAFLRKPKVKDFETLREDIGSMKGFWQNKVTRILLMVVFTNLGSMLGTLVAIPLMVRVFSG